MIMTDRTIAWGKKVGADFKASVLWIEQDLGIPADDQMNCMAFESGQTFSPSVKNAAGSGATGLIQFMPTTAGQLHTTTDALAHMTAVQQLNYVWKYFSPYKGRLHNLGDVYMSILWPAAIGKDDASVIFDKATMPTAYLQNRGLDFNKDGQVTRLEAYQHVKDLVPLGEKWRG
jgi:hypothetical protein